jgi:hypothetical protein
MEILFVTNKIITFPKSKENHLDKAGLTLYLSESNLDKLSQVRKARI